MSTITPFRMSGAELREIVASTSARTKAHKAAKAELERRAAKHAAKAEPVVVVEPEPAPEPEPEVTREQQLKAIRKWASDDAKAYAAEHAGPGDFVRTMIVERGRLLDLYMTIAEQEGALLPA